NRLGGSIFKDTHFGNIPWVEEANVVIPYTVYHVKRIRITINRSCTANTNLRRCAGRAGVRDLHAGNPSLQRTYRIGCRLPADLLSFDIRYGSGDIYFALLTVSYNNKD